MPGPRSSEVRGRLPEFHGLHGHGLGIRGFRLGDLIDSEERDLSPMIQRILLSVSPADRVLTLTRFHRYFRESGC